MRVINFLGGLLEKPREFWKSNTPLLEIPGNYRKQIEQDRYLKKKYNVKMTYEYYTRTKNPINYISKRYFLYPYYSCYKNRKLNKDVLFQIHFQDLGDLALFLDKERTIITCQDIYNLLFQKSLEYPIFAQKYAILGLKRCRVIIAISEFTKNELVSKLKIPKEKIFVIKDAVNQDIFKPISDNNISDIEPLFPDYKKILFVGTEQPRKDFLTLIKAFYMIKNNYPGQKIKLIRVGSPKYLNYIKQLGLEKDIHYFNNISDNRLREIYNLCDFFISPSLYEGYGLPGMEAASCGTPVICTNIPVFKELYQDFPIYFPPQDYKTLAREIAENIDNDDLKRDMGEKGLHISGKYSWEKSAEKYYKVLKFIVDIN